MAFRRMFVHVPFLFPKLFLTIRVDPLNSCVQVDQFYNKGFECSVRVKYTVCSLYLAERVTNVQLDPNLLHSLAQVFLLLVWNSVDNELTFSLPIFIRLLGIFLAQSTQKRQGDDKASQHTIWKRVLRHI
uniref:Uncharacterized protein n=1 Tax=Cacopsylla melanoneura TaxID=428564 RepID=A0A8D8RCM6_9HEMI